ncbi:selenocysteine insertion sequence-binding protein 2-like isoform X2 [Anguilla anguilla]|uniref:selenocysteine insertion sequence-binding protein 2-like isoform X2 n=1 Tax=Anguilla anguilla TaxID=7936 RepID=UPI0015AC11E3|nr:selenocysteine insertion sequence-binding protein 2-like isoform X2 [Anguilla anguilla]
MDHSDNKDVKLSAEVEPFIPQRKGGDVAPVTMNWSREGGGAGAEATPIPSYLITCFPFVQENQPNSRYSLCTGDPRWQQPSSGPGGPYLAYPLLTSPQAPVSSDYAYYQLLPTPCSPMMGFYPPFSTPYGGPLQTGVVSPMPADCSDRPLPPGQEFSVACQRGRGTLQTPVLPMFSQPMRAKRPPMRSVAVQKETAVSGPGSRSKTVLLVDATQQTDFPAEVAGATLSERASPLLWKSRVRRRRASPQVTESSSEHAANEADIDSDSGYCSPKHNQTRLGLRPPDPASTTGVEAGVMTALSWVNMASQKPWMNRKAAFLRAGSAPEPRSYAQLDLQAGHHGRGSSISVAAERGYGLQNRLQDGGVQTARTHTGMTTEPLYFEDEDEFPQLVSTGAPVLSKPEEAQPKITKNGLDNLPESSPISIVQTPIPITTSVPKRAKSQRKKALAAALATAQEYSEISMEQRKLQEALTKAAGKKSKLPVQLDLGDMLAALERQQQAMRARQINNTKPLSYTVGTTAVFHCSDRGGSASAMKSPHYSAPHNILDSSAPRMKRGKEREIPKVKRPTALKKVILKEREGKMGRPSVDQDGTDLEEQGDEQLHLSQGVSQEDNGLSMPSDASLSPASQNSPYSITPISQGSPASSGIGSPMATSAITKIHSRRFREYCNQVLNKDIDESVTLLLQELMRFQERVYQKDPIKAKAKRRLVMGLREVTKHMRLHNVKCVIISPNCEKIQAKGGLDEALYNVIAMAREQEIPFVFALGRKALGRCVNKLVPVSVVGIFNYSGAEGLFSRLVSLTEEARRAYRDMVSALEQEQAEEALKTVKRVPHHMGHSRNPSAASAISFCSVISEPISEVNEREYETNWRNMVESSDGAEAENEGEECDRQDVTAAYSVPGSAPPPAPVAPPAVRAGAGAGPEREEGRPDDRLELASQQSTETGSLDGSCRDRRLPPSITSTASTLVPGMLEEEEEEEEGEEPVSVEVPSVSSRIESWVSETLQNLQVGGARDSAEEEEEEEEEEDDEEEEGGEVGHSDEEELDSSELSEPGLDPAEQTLEA